MYQRGRYLVEKTKANPGTMYEFIWKDMAWTNEMAVRTFSIACLPIYGGLPVKFRTYIGEPIPYDPNITAKELAEKTKIALENLRDRHQKRPGNILRALLERFDKNKKE